MPPPYSKLTHSVILTNSIQEIILGSVDVGQRGYEYADFIPNGEMSNKYASYLTYTNGIGYVLVGTNYVAISDSGKTMILGKNKIWKIRLLVFGLMALCSIGFGWYAIRYHSIARKGSNYKQK